MQGPRELPLGQYVVEQIRYFTPDIQVNLTDVSLGKFSDINSGGFGQKIV